MPRRPRLFSTEHAHHIVSRGNNRQKIFRDGHDFERFLFDLKALRSEHAFDVYHYCLMPNHVHLLVRFADERSFRRAPQRLFLRYAKYFSRRYRHVGHVFQDRFRSLPVTDNAYLLECGRYIERNPVKAGLVDHPADYPWSSYGFYGEGKTDPVITADPLYDGIASQNHRRVYERYVRTDRPYEEFMERALFGRRKLGKVSP